MFDNKQQRPFTMRASHGKGESKTGKPDIRTIFENYEVQYLHRRLTAAGLGVLEYLRNIAHEHAVEKDSEGAFMVYWRANLPNIGLNNIYMQRSLSNELVKRVPDIERSMHVCFEVYCKAYFGRDVHGNVNVINGTVPPMSEFYHCFLTRLCADPAVVRMQVFEDNAVLENAVRGAMLDALRDTSMDRVNIVKTIPAAEFLAQARRQRKKQIREESPEESVRESPTKRSGSEHSDRTEDTDAGTSRDKPPAGERHRKFISADSDEDDTGIRLKSSVPASISTGVPKEGVFTLNDPTVAPPGPKPRAVLPAVSEDSSSTAASAVSIHGEQWLQRLEASKALRKSKPQLGPEDSASNVNSIGLQHQQAMREEQDSLPPANFRKVSMPTTDTASVPPKSRSTRSSLFSENISLL
jgi:hypothetical protein